MARWSEYESARKARTPSATPPHLARQLEKDERFWVVSALMSLFHQPEDKRPQAFADLFGRANLPVPSGHPSWNSALAGELHLFFEVNLPAPSKYKKWLRQHLDDRVLIPYVREAADTRGDLLEGATKADAMLLAADTGVAVIFEAKVLSDVSTNITFDVARNQLARLIDVMLERPGKGSPLNKRNPALTSLVLITPEMFRPPTVHGLDRSRLYGWLMPEYRNPDSHLLEHHLSHLEPKSLEGVSSRLGWASWEDFNAVQKNCCSWIHTSGPNGLNPES
jgi:hypothetical protein